MSEPRPDKKKQARDRALATGWVPLDPYPGYLTWFFRAYVEHSGGPELDALCWMFPHREIEILDTWCTLAQKDPWAWDEARAKLRPLVTGGKHPPTPLARFAIVARPGEKSGPCPELALSIRREFFARVMEQEGFDGDEVNSRFDASFPSEKGRKDPGSTLRKSRAKGRAFVAPVFDIKDGGDSPTEESPRPVVLEYDWSEPAEAARVLLTSGWPALALLWEFWPEHRDEHVARWCEDARSDSWLWGEVWALLNHAVYCGWHRPEVLDQFAEHPQPGRPPDPRDQAALRVRLAAVVRKLQLHGHSQRDARAHCVEALGGSAGDLDPTTHSTRFNLGRERLRGLISLEIW